MKVEILPEAWDELRVIWDHYFYEFDRKTADKVSDHILSCIERLEAFPDSGSSTPDDWLNSLGFQMVIAGQHIAIYKQVGESIFVYHIADTRTDYPTIFKNLLREKGSSEK